MCQSISRQSAAVAGDIPPGALPQASMDASPQPVAAEPPAADPVRDPRRVVGVVRAQSGDWIAKVHEGHCLQRFDGVFPSRETATEWMFPALRGCAPDGVGRWEEGETPFVPTYVQ